MKKGASENGDFLRKYSILTEDHVTLRARILLVISLSA